MTKWLAILAAGLPLLVLAAAALVHQLQGRKAGERPPLREKLLRPPGESRRREIRRRWQRFLGMSLGLGGCSVVFGLVFLLASETGKSSQYLPALVLLALGAALFLWLGWRAVAGVRRLRMEWLACQAVAGRLKELAGAGYRVFHDVPGGGRWTIDHAVVGPGGVFAVATNHQVRRPSSNDLQEHEAVFDGRTIHLPWCTDEKSVAQAERNAKWLGKWLSKAVGEEVTARPIVVLPGWDVKPKGDGETQAFSGTALAEHIAGAPTRLSEGLVRKIAQQLDSRCRDMDL